MEFQFLKLSGIYYFILNFANLNGSLHKCWNDRFDLILWKSIKKHSWCATSFTRHFLDVDYRTNAHVVPLFNVFENFNLRSGREKTENVLDVEPTMLYLVEKNPSISLRLLAYWEGASPFVVWRIQINKVFIPNTCKTHERRRFSSYN